MRIIPAFIHVPDDAGGNAVRNLLSFACDNETPIFLDEDTFDKQAPEGSTIDNRHDFMHPRAQELFNQDAWGESDSFPRQDWVDKVVSGDTQLGYWEWLSHQLEILDYQ